MVNEKKKTFVSVVDMLLFLLTFNFVFYFTNNPHRKSKFGYHIELWLL